MLNGTKLLIAGALCIACGVLLLVFAPGEVNTVFAGMLITGGLTLLGVKPTINAINRNNKPKDHE